jgi:hypothetical protein
VALFVEERLLAGQSSLQEGTEVMRVIGPAGQFVDDPIRAVQQGIKLDGLPRPPTRAARVHLGSEPIMLTPRRREWHVVGERHRILATRIHHQTDSVSALLSASKSGFPTAWVALYLGNLFGRY